MQQDDCWMLFLRVVFLQIATKGKLFFTEQLPRARYQGKADFPRKEKPYNQKASDSVADWKWETTRLKQPSRTDKRLQDKRSNYIGNYDNMRATTRKEENKKRKYLTQTQFVKKIEVLTV